MNKLQLKRRLLGLTAMQVAQKVGISETHYKNIETGYMRPKNPEVYEKIAKVVGLRKEELFDEVPQNILG